MHQYCDNAESPFLGYFSWHLQLAAGAAGSECKCGSTCAHNFLGKLGEVKFCLLSTGWSFAFATAAALGSCLLGGRASCGSGAELPGSAGFDVWIMHGQGSAWMAGSRCVVTGVICREGLRWIALPPERPRSRGSPAPAQRCLILGGF